MSDLVLTQENKPKARPIAKHKLIYMKACELPPVSGIGRLRSSTPIVQGHKALVSYPLIVQGRKACIGRPIA